MDYYSLFIPHFLKGNVNCAAIARKTKKNERTVQRYFKKYMKQIPIPKKVQVGRPKKYSASINTRIGQIVKSTPIKTSKEIAKKLNEETGSSISDRTVRRRLEIMEYEHAKPNVVPDIQPHHINQRKKFYKDLQFPKN